MSDFVEQLREVASASLLPENGELTVSGLAEPVEILRDRWGVPYISAASLDDLWFAQGFVTAGERLFQMDLLLRAASGRLSEVFADRTLADDRFARTIGFSRTGRSSPPDGTTPHTRSTPGSARGARRGWRRCRRHPSSTPCSTWPRACRPTTPERGRRRSSTWRGGSPGTGTRSCSARRSPNVSGPTRSACSSRRCRPIRRRSPRARSRVACSTSSRARRARGRTIGWWRVRARRPASRCSRTTRTCSPCSPARGSRCTSALPGTRRAAWRSRSRPASCSARRRITRGASRT